MCSGHVPKPAKIQLGSPEAYGYVKQSDGSYLPPGAVQDRVSDGVRRLKESVEAQCRALGEERVREMVAEGWTLCEWTTTEGNTVTLHAQLMPASEEKSHNCTDGDVCSVCGCQDSDECWFSGCPNCKCCVKHRVGPMTDEEFEEICLAVEQHGAYGQMLRVAAEARRARAALLAFERETADENDCSIHPKTILRIGCNACADALRAEVERLREHLGAANDNRARWHDAAISEKARAEGVALLNEGVAHLKECDAARIAAEARATTLERALRGLVELVAEAERLGWVGDDDVYLLPVVIELANASTEAAAVLGGTKK